jgi:predicted PurR-regulated permease PerM
MGGNFLIGAKLGGLIGLLVAIPLASFIKEVADRWRAGVFKVESLERFDKN